MRRKRSRALIGNPKVTEMAEAPLFAGGIKGGTNDPVFGKQTIRPAEFCGMGKGAALLQ